MFSLNLSSEVLLHVKISANLSCPLIMHIVLFKRTPQVPAGQFRAPFFLHECKVSLLLLGVETFSSSCLHACG